MNINYEYYRTFYYAARYKSLTRAARVLFSNQPNVTRTINKLEKELGCQLFVRSRNGLTLTPEGEKLYAHVHIAVEQLEDAETELSKSLSMETGTISIAATETALNVFLLEKLREFHDIYPDIHLHISNQSTPQALLHLDQGLADFAVVTTPFLPTEYMEQESLMTFQDYLVGGADYASLAGHSISLRELKQYPLIMMNSATATHQFYNDVFLRQNLSLSAEIEASTTDQVLSLVRYNLGLGFLPEPMAREYIERQEINTIPLAESIPPREIVFVTDCRRPLGTAAKRLYSILKDSDL